MIWPSQSCLARARCGGGERAPATIVMQQKTHRPVQFEITQPTRDTVQAWINQAGLRSGDFLFPNRIHDSPHLGTRQYARILEGWVEELGLDSAAYGTHSIRRMRAKLGRHHVAGTGTGTDYPQHSMC